MLVHDQEPSRGHLFELTACIPPRLQRGAKALSQRLMGRSLERVHHGCGHLRGAHHVGDRHAVPARSAGMDGANFVPRKVRRPPTGIDHRQLAPTTMGRGRYQCVDRLLGGETEVEERKPARAEAGIRPMLGQRRTDPGAGKLAAIADGDGGCGDDGAEHARTRAAPSKRVGHGVVLRVAWLP